MIRISHDKTIFFLAWFLILGLLNYLSTEELKVFDPVKLEKIDLNQAQLEDLMQIPRLSLKVAMSILEERNKRGCFKNWEELEEISGVGVKTLEKLKMFLKRENLCGQ